MTLDFRPQALLFDMDGLLLDSERLILDCFADVAPRFGRGAEEARDFALTLIGTSGAETRKRIATFVSDAEAFWQGWHVAIEEIFRDGVPVKPGADGVLAELSGKGHRMAVVTSTHGNRARAHLESAGILHHFERVTGGDEVSATKPDPAPYREAAEALGVDPGACVAFEDSDAGTASAVAAGCVVVQVPDLRPAGKALPELGQRRAETLAEAIRGLGL